MDTAHKTVGYYCSGGGGIGDAKSESRCVEAQRKKALEVESRHGVLVLSTFLKKRSRYYRLLSLYSWVASILRPCWEKRRHAQLRKLYEQFLLSSLKSCKLCLYLYYTAVKWLTVTFEDHVLDNLRSAICIYQHLFYDVLTFVRKETCHNLHILGNSLSDLCVREDKYSEYTTSDEDDTEDEEIESDVESNQYTSEEEELDEQTLQLYCQIATNALRRLPSYKIRSTCSSSCCSICLEQYYAGQYVRVLRCGHPFHADCVFRWCSLGHFTCPNCRAKLLT